MTSDEQRAAADRIAAAYDETSRITPNQGPLRDLMTVACPDGRMVVLTVHGSILADSANPAVWDQSIVRSLQRGENP